MYIVIADGNVIFSTDVDDLAQEVSQENENDFEKIYVEEVYQNQFDSKGKYITTMGDVITIQEILSAEQSYRDEDMLPKLNTKPVKKKTIKKVSRKYWEEKVDSLYNNATKRMLFMFNISFDEDAGEVELKNILEKQLKSILKQDDEFADSVFVELDTCSEICMNIDSMIRFKSSEEAQSTLINKIKTLDNTIVPEGNEFELADILFECISHNADSSGKSMQDVFNAI